LYLTVSHLHDGLQGSLLFGFPTFQWTGLGLNYMIIVHGRSDTVWLLPRLASNHGSSDLCHPSSWDYRREPLAPGQIAFSGEASHHVARTTRELYGYTSWRKMEVFTHKWHYLASQWGRYVVNGFSKSIQPSADFSSSYHLTGVSWDPSQNCLKHLSKFCSPETVRNNKWLLF
jgi:hypothetical protein